MRHLLLITRTGKNKVCFFFPVSGRELHSLRIFQQRQSNGWGREPRLEVLLWVNPKLRVSCTARMDVAQVRPLCLVTGVGSSRPPLFPVFHWGWEGFTPQTLHQVTLRARSAGSRAHTGLVRRELMGKQGMNMQMGKSMRPVSSGLCQGNVWDRNCPAGSSLGASLTSIL